MTIPPRSLKNTLLLAVALIVMTTGLAISQLVAHQYSRSLLDGAVARAENIAHKLALDGAEKVLINDLVSLQKMLDAQRASDPTVAYVFVVRDGHVVAHTFIDGIPINLIHANDTESGDSGRIQKIVAEDGKRYIDAAYPIFGGKAGTMRLGLAESSYRRQVRQLWIQMSLIAFGILAISLAVSHWVISRLIRPLQQLTRCAEQINADSLGAKVAIRGREEVSTLARAFNSMLMRLEEYTKELEASKTALERQNRELERTHRQLTTSFSISQKIAALPKLDQICRFLIEALRALVPCRDIHLMVFSPASQSVNFASSKGIRHLDDEHYHRLYGAVSRHRQPVFIRQPEIGQLALPRPLDGADQIAVLPVNHHEMTIGALMVACGNECGCAPQELDIVTMILHQAAGAIHRANNYEVELLKLRKRIEVGTPFGEIVGKDPKIQMVFKLIEDVAPTDTTVLILGESGTGKELAARAIHHRSHRAENPFVVINCTAYPNTLLESELFGHEKGAFTGAVRRKIGRFEQADGGTVFLDEIGEIDPAAQTKLLRVLQQQTIDRLGGERPIKVNVRILAATNKDLAQEVREGRFREDLYYRLNVIPIQMPPLRERPTDIVLLAQHFLNRFCREQGKQISGFRSEVIRKLLDNPWLGNVRELENSIEHAVVLAKGDQIELMDLPLALRESNAPEIHIQPPTMVESEARLIQDRLDACGWNKAEAARQLGISRSTLYEKIKKFNIAVPSRLQSPKSPGIR